MLAVMLPFAAVAACFLVSFPDPVRGQLQDPVVRIEHGEVIGRSLRVSDGATREVFAFQGIPYALPPTGNRRFASPEAHPGWSNPLIASQSGAPCPQLGGTRGPANVQPKEDCLYLDVYTPQLRRGFAGLPVVVLLAGELFETGSAASTPGTDLAANDVVVVLLNYRLNVFGFLSLENPLAPGNAGLEDQRLALQWVRTNIEHFGGDTTRITLMGHSAGAASAMFHLLAPQSQDLFDRLILMSGSALSPWALSSRPRDYARDLGRRLRCSTGPDPMLLQCIRSRSAEEVLAAFQSQRSDSTLRQHGALYGPVIDGPNGLIPRHPEEALRLGRFPRIPILIGCSKDDGSIMLWLGLKTDRSVERLDGNAALPDYHGLSRNRNERELRTFMELSGIPGVLEAMGISEHATPAGLPTVLLLYLYGIDGKANRDATFRGIVQFYTDAYFQVPVSMAVPYLARSDQLFLYLNDFPSFGDIYGNAANFSGSLHGAELLYLLSPSLYQETQGRRMSREEDQFAKELKRMWTEFSRSGNPTPYFSPDAKTWDPYDPLRPTKMMLGSRRMEDSSSEERQVSLWSHVLRQVAKAATTPSPWLHSTPLFTPSPESQIEGEPYRAAMWVLVACVLVLLILLVASGICISRRRKHDLTATAHLRPFRY
ncbi:unnamed protein product [Darwinula stevensoni]|uniref:Carboxylic ester hydrolase n=1 Tax=Darwinula stevensoni TaxID=69355 RepID=A0A7R9AET8_9CRUS|nr:unnamed protein product [Darwinula stevensoni]CAG0902653.1 unnamed protein product [Darwinula stevensoni]